MKITPTITTNNIVKGPGIVKIISIWYSFFAFYLVINQVSLTLARGLPPRTVGILLPVLMIGFAIFLVVTAWGLWQLKGWAYRAALNISKFLVLINLLGFVVSLAYGLFPPILSLLLHG